MILTTISLSLQENQQQLEKEFWSRCVVTIRMNSWSHLLGQLNVAYDGIRGLHSAHSISGLQCAFVARKSSTTTSDVSSRRYKLQYCRSACLEVTA